MRNLGGNEVSTLEGGASGTTVFADRPYYYGLHYADATTPLEMPELQAMTVYLLEAPASAEVREESLCTVLKQGDCVQAHHVSPRIVVRGEGRCAFLVAGVAVSTQRKELLALRAEEIKRVVKPWGHELWISGEHPEYALKQVFIRAPHKTSLQYHNLKHETIVLLSGAARLHHLRDGSSPGVGGTDTIATPLSPVSVAHIKPPVLHRFEACSDLTLYEASTPHLHDVIRVSDDSNRPDGKIESEHQAASPI